MSCKRQVPSRAPCCHRYADAGAQAAIDAAQAAGGGVVYFPPGRYQFAPPGTMPGPILHVTSSNIVIRGAGSQPAAAGGTELYIDAMRTGDTDVLIEFEGVSKGTQTLTHALVGCVQTHICVIDKKKDGRGVYAPPPDNRCLHTADPCPVPLLVA
jgi:hypothetical protein